MLNFKSALVSGATGFIGSALVKRLARENIKVYCLVRPESNQQRLKGVSGLDFLEVPCFEARRLRPVLAGVKVDIVFNLAAYGVKPTDRDPEEMVRGNITLLTALLAAVNRDSLRMFIHTGSCSEYGLPGDRRLINENDAIKPVSLYGAAKAASVIYGKALAAALNIPFVILRLFGVYGPGEEANRLIPYIISRLNAGDDVDLTPGRQERDLLFIDDVVEAYIAAAEADNSNANPVYNVCSAQPVEIREAALLTAALLGADDKRLRFGARPYRSDEHMWLVGDNRLFKSSVSWQPRVGLQAGIEKMIKQIGKSEVGRHR